MALNIKSYTVLSHNIDNPFINTMYLPTRTSLAGNLLPRTGRLLNTLQYEGVHCKWNILHPLTTISYHGCQSNFKVHVS